VVNGLTKDVSVDACIFDLIDNSIDAARETIFADRSPEDQKTLPESYAGFEIKLTLSGNGFKIEDNCGGISVEPLKTMVLRFRKRSSHQLGIGIFGVGLNRALFKLGKVSHLRTDTGKQRAELILKTDDYLKSDDWELPAQEFQSTGQVGTEIEIRQLPSDIASNFADKTWVDARRERLARRYGRFIEKGLALSVNRIPIPNHEIQCAKIVRMKVNTSSTRPRMEFRSTSNMDNTRIIVSPKRPTTTPIGIRASPTSLGGRSSVMIAQLSSRIPHGKPVGRASIQSSIFTESESRGVGSCRISFC
jgi:Histidine kinase-, DNA gyrase B-, and HSP90-like ATPase